MKQTQYKLRTCHSANDVNETGLILIF